MSVLIYLLFASLVVCCGSILVVGLVVNYLIVVWFSYHFNYLHKSHDISQFASHQSLLSSDLADPVM